MGKTNPVTILVVLALVFVGWCGYLYVPLVFDNMDVSEAAATIVNLAPTTESSRAIAQPLLTLNSKVGWHYGVDEETGEEKILPGLGLTEENIELVVDGQAKLVSCTITYQRTIQLKPFQRRRTFNFRTHHEQHLQ